LPSSFNPGDLIDVKDSRKQWCVAEILKVELEEGKILIHYVGWSDKWNESIKMNDKSKIAV
jgi:kynurenine formamidase